MAKKIKYKHQPQVIESLDYLEFMESLNFMFDSGNDNDLVNEYKPQVRGFQSC